MRLTDEIEKALRRKAHNNVLRLRGACDVPGFDLCANAEYYHLKNDFMLGVIDVEDLL